ncbi:MAG: hypothetical protein NZ873_01335 [Crenarchaeota archaeon]|nr:hypothetical protein [Thermoproteota archaeon]MDW8034007.1 hypothetical protein [Nitrososphaerota archaeon]
MRNGGKKSPFMFPENRLKLARLIRGKGFYVRMHGYEYLVSHDGRFLCLIFLQPNNRIIMIKVFKWIEDSHNQVKEIVELIRSIDSVSELVFY